MKIISTTFIFLINLYPIFEFTQCYKSKDYSDAEKDAMKNLKMYQVGVLSKIPDGPLTGEELQEAMKEDYEKNNGISKGTKVGVVYVSDNLRNKRLGKTRIKSKGITMLFPTDVERIKYQDFRDNEHFKSFMANNRVEFEKNKLIDSETDYTKNPYKEIYDYESKIMDYGVLDVKKDEHKKNLLQLAVEKEQQIYNNMVNNEVTEVQGKRFNKGFYNPAYKYIESHKPVKKGPTLKYFL